MDGMNDESTFFSDEEWGEQMMAGMGAGQALHLANLDEIVIECPVIIEFVGTGLAPEVRDQFIYTAMAQIRQSIMNA